MSEAKTVRHQKKQACVVGSRYGDVHIDPTGLVTNLDELECTAEELCELPNYVDGEIFGGTKPRPSVVAAYEETSEEEGEEDVAAIIAQLKADGAPTTGEGYIQMDALNAELKERGIQTISGTQRKEIEDAAAGDGDES